MNISKAKHKIKPLEIGDIMVALINQQNTVDRTEQYKKILAEYNEKSSDQKIIITKTDIKSILPQFTLQHYSYQQLLAYHIRNKTMSENISQYEILLKEVDQQIKDSLESYDDKLKQGQRTLNELTINLGKACEILGFQRKCVNLTTDRIKQGYAGIAPKLRKINNINKVLQITKVWGSAKLPYIISIDTKNPHRYDIKDIFELIRQAKNIINSITKKSPVLKKMLVNLDEKTNEIIKNICEHFLNSIINFTSINQYQKHYNQYIYISSQNACHNILSHEGIQSIIQNNSKKMFNDILKKINVLQNVDLLNQSNYLTFYDQIIQQFVIYFRSWHFVTKFHIDKQTGYQNLFLQNRRYVFVSLSQSLANSIKFSNKFISLQYKIKLKLCEKFQDYIEAGIKWMGYSENAITLLKKSVSEKMNKQLQQLFTAYNNLIKNILAKQISLDALQKVDQVPQKYIPKGIGNADDIDYNRVASFLGKQAKQLIHLETQINGNIKTQRIKSQLPPPPIVNLTLSKTLIEMISQYLQRSKYLGRRKNIYINKIQDHFQLILYSLLQVGIRRHIIQKLNSSIQEKLKSIFQQNKIKIGSSEDLPSLRKMNQIWKIDQLQRKYELITQFQTNVGNKYQGIHFSGYLDVDKVYQSSQQILNKYMRLIVRIFRDLIKIENWLIKVTPQSQLSAVKNGVQTFSKILELTNLSFMIFIENHIQFQKERIIQSFQFSQKLKWDIKKVTPQVQQTFRQQRLRFLEIYRNNTLINTVNLQCQQTPVLIELVKDLEIENVYKTLLEIYGKIQKINDSGRQMLRIDFIEISNTLKQIGIFSEHCSWESWFERYFQFMNDKSYKKILEKASKVAVLYPPVSWKYSVIWAVGDMSYKQKKEYSSQLSRIYYEYFLESK